VNVKIAAVVIRSWRFLWIQGHFRDLAGRIPVKALKCVADDVENLQSPMPMITIIARWLLSIIITLTAIDERSSNVRNARRCGDLLELLCVWFTRVKGGLEENLADTSTLCELEATWSKTTADTILDTCKIHRV
jgi:hypothetical protein